MEQLLLTEVTQLLAPKMAILVIVLLLLGVGLKLTPRIPDWLIVWILLGAGILFALFLLGFHVEAVLQGILAAGAAVLTHQVWKQTKINKRKD